MAAAGIETQRLIYVSLGKIAQSRGQRGGINLHKNLLVATVLHKARTAHMMETYNFQQQQQRQVIQQQKLQQEQLLQQQQQHAIEQRNLSPSSEIVCNNDTSPVAQNEQVCQASCVVPEVGQRSVSSAGSEETGSNICSTPPDACEEAMVVQESKSPVVDKENNPPLSAEIPQTVTEMCDTSTPVSDHIAAANKLSHDSQIVQDSSCQKQTSTSGSTTCQGILKRRRVNLNTISSSDSSDVPVSKRARVSHDSSSSVPSSRPSTPTFVSFISENSDYSSDESDSECEPELSKINTQDSSQITNLVSIFNSGFSGLCAQSVDSSSGLNDSGYQSDHDISSSPQYTTLTKLRPESPTPSYQRKMSETSLMCCSEVGRLDSLNSAIVLSA